jgi:signal transduction histidine kinase
MADRLFDSMVSLREKKGDTPHLGLGLHIVRLVAEFHGGSVAAENLPAGDGVVFTVRLPLTGP